jgi:RIO kinase 1
MNDPLDPLLADGVIDEVVARLRGGKEADVWVVRHAGEVVIAKVYKERDVRSFKNDAAYKEGRRVRNTRTQRAMDRGSRFGQAAAAEAWKSKEADALYKLHAAGLRVPRPVMFYEGVLLMELVVDGEGRPAPRLLESGLAPSEAAKAYADLRRQVVGMLTCDLIHGDLSPYNVLMGRDGPVVIDFPQVIEAAHNSQAERFLLRDLHNVHQYFAGLDPALRAAEGDGREIWRAYTRRELTPDFVPTGRPPPERQPHHARREGGGGRRAGPPQGQGQRPGQGQAPRQAGQGQGQQQSRRPVGPGGGPQRPGGPPPHGRPHPPQGAHAAHGEHPRHGQQGQQGQHGQHGPQGQRGPHGPPGGHATRGEHPAHGGRPAPAPGGQRRPDPRDRRSGSPMPEVIRVVRPAQGPAGPGGPAGSGRPGGAGGGHPGGGHGHGQGHGHGHGRRRGR